MLLLQILSRWNNILIRVLSFIMAMLTSFCWMGTFCSYPLTLVRCIESSPLCHHELSIPKQKDMLTIFFDDKGMRIVNIFWYFFQYITCLPRCQCMFWNHIFCPPFVEDYTKPRTMLLDLEIGLWMRIKIHNELIELINQIKIMSIMGLSFHYSWFLPVPPLEAVIGCRK